MEELKPWKPDCYLGFVGEDVDVSFARNGVYDGNSRAVKAAMLTTDIINNMIKGVKSEQ